MKQQLDITPGFHGALWYHERNALTPLLASHHHDELEFNLVIKGNGRYLLSDRSYSLSPRSMVWLFPEQEHQLVETSSDFCMWIGVISMRKFKGGPEILRATNPPEACAHKLSNSDAADIMQLCSQLAASIHNGPDTFNAGIFFTILQAWHAYSRARVDLATQLHPAVEEALHLLKQDNSTELPVLAEHTGLSSSYLSRLFQQQVGCTVATFRARDRIERFIQHFEPNGSQTMLAAALEAGFGSYAQFHRIFTRIMQQSPRKWLESGAPSLLGRQH